MKRIDENQLAARVASLKEKIAEIENAQFDEGIGSAIWNGVKGAGTAIGNALSTTGGKLAAGAGLGAGALAAGQALTKPGQAAAPTGTTKVPGKSDPAVLKQQQDLIAKGAKIKADGIMGPATQAAIKQFGGAAPAAPTGTTAPAAPTGTTAPAAPAGDAAKNPVGTTNASTAIPTGGLENPANQATPAAAPAAAPVSGAPANVTAQGSEFGTDATFAKPAAPTGSAALNPANGSAATTIPSGPQTVPGQQGSAALNPAVNGDKATSIPSGPGTAAGNAPTGSAAVQNNANSSVQAESVGFQNEELSRILTLIHHR